MMADENLYPQPEEKPDVERWLDDGGPLRPEESPEETISPMTQADWLQLASDADKLGL